MEQIIEQINQFNAADFQTEAPYKILHTFSGNKFEQSQLELIAEQRAKDVGFKKFRTMYKNYLASVPKATSTVPITNLTGFTDQPLELNCGGWIATDNGVYRVKRNGEEEYACAHPIMPTARLIDLDTGETKLTLSFRLPGSKSIWQEITVNMTVVATARNITTLSNWGIAVTSNTAPALVAFLHDLLTSNCDTIPTYRCVARLGHFPNIGFAPYAESLRFGGNAEYLPLFQTVTAHGSYSAWHDTVLDFRQQSIPARILLAASFASPLLSVVGCLPFFAHCWCITSGNGKSVALMVAASVWGNPAPGKYVQTHNATQVGMERTAAFLNHLPYCLDELQLAKDGRGHSKLDVYQLAEGTGRTRGNKSGVDITPTWRCCFLSTGETPIASLTSGAGAINRVVDLNCPAETFVVKDGPKFANSVLENYGFAGEIFVNKLYQSAETQVEIKKIYNANRTALSATGATDKQAMAGAALLTADQLATEWIFKDGNGLTVDDIAPFLAKSDSTSLGREAYEYLCDWVASNMRHFEQSGTESFGEIYGVIEGGLAFIIRSEFRKVLEARGYDEQVVLNYMRDKRLIYVKDKKGFGHTKRFGAATPQCIALKLFTCAFLPMPEPRKETTA